MSFAFAAMVADQWVRRRRPYQLVWTLGLLWYGISAGTEFIGSAFGWNEPLYRAWYLFGAFGVAAWLGLGTVYLLRNTRFGYVVAFSILAGGLFSVLSAYARLADAAGGRDPSLWGPALAMAMPVVIASALGALAVALATRIERRLAAHVAAGLLVIGSLLAAVLTLGAPLAPPGYHLEATGVPTGTAFPDWLRILTPPFNIAGAFALVFGAVYSAYIFMPKRRVLRVEGRMPVLGAVVRAAAVVVNFVASLPATWRAFRAGQLNSRVPATLLIALGGFIPGWTSGLNRFGITWAFFLGEFVGVVLIFIGFLVSIEVFSDLRLPFTRVVLVRRDRSEASGGG